MSTNKGFEVINGAKAADGSSVADTLPRFVRVREITENNLVEFDFAIGEPDLFVELVLPKPAFDEFCIKQNVQMMTQEQCRMVDQEMEKWRIGEEAFAKRNQTES
jgi:phenol hydroxylase P0 protein